MELIRSLTDLIDAEVGKQSGILGKHAGDGASALFVVDHGSSESATAAGIEHVAREGAALASKALIERLEPADAAAALDVRRDWSR